MDPCFTSADSLYLQMRCFTSAFPLFLNSASPAVHYFIFDYFSYLLPSFFAEASIFETGDALKRLHMVSSSLI